jgi:hypothetical protein
MSRGKRRDFIAKTRSRSDARPFSGWRIDPPNDPYIWRIARDSALRGTRVLLLLVPLRFEYQARPRWNRAAV